MWPAMVEGGRKGGKIQRSPFRGLTPVDLILERENVRERRSGRSLKNGWGTWRGEWNQGKEEKEISEKKFAREKGSIMSGVSR